MEMGPPFTPTHVPIDGNSTHAAMFGMNRACVYTRPAPRRAPLWNAPRK